jgi:hypothetical protein
MIIMKKYTFGILGLFIGFALATTIGAYAQEAKTVIGQVIDGAFAVKIDGKQLDNPAIVVQGTSYLPVREFSEATGYNVKFDADLGIELTKNEVTPTPTPDITKEQRKKEVNDELGKTALEIQDLTSKIGKEKTQYRDENGNVTYNGKETIDQATIDAYQKQIDDKQARVQELIKERDALQSQQ